MIFTAPNLDAAIQGTLRIVGQATQADRAYLFRHHDHPEHPALTQSFEWCGPGTKTTKESEKLKNARYADLGLLRWYREFQERKSIRGPAPHKRPVVERTLFSPQPVLSLIVIPVFSENVLWGFMGFDDCHQKRQWPTADEDVLVSLADSIGHAVEWHSKDEDLRTSEARYRNLVESLTDIVFITDYASHMLFANSALESQTGFTIHDFQMAQQDNEFIHPDDVAMVAGFISRFIAGHQTVSDVIENRFIDKWGRTHWYASVLSKVEYADKPALQFVTHDITESRLAAQSLRESEERYRAFVTQSSEGIYRVELEKPIPVALAPDEQIAMFYQYGYLAECNGVMAQMYGFAGIDEAIGVRLSSLLVPDDPHNIEYLRSFVRQGYRMVDLESHEVDKDGNPKFFLNNAIGIIENGNLIRIWGTQRDITERKQWEHTLEENRANLLAVLENTRDSIWAVDLDYRIVTINSVFHRAFLTAFRVDLKPGMHVLEVLPDDLRSIWKERYDRVLKGGESFVVTDHYDFGGIDADFEISFHPIVTEKGDVRGATLFSRDITERKHAEAAVARSERHFRSLIENALDMITILNADATIRYESPSVTRILGYAANEITGHSIFGFVHPTERHRLMETFHAGQSGSRHIRDEEFRFRHKDGSWRTLEVSGHNLLHDSAVQGIVVNSRDITQRRMAEDALRNSEARFRAIFDGSGIGIALTTLHDGKLIETNPQFNKMFGYEPGELDGRMLKDISHPDDAGVNLEYYRQLTSGERQSYQVERRYRHKEGHWVWGRLTTSLVRDSDGRPQFVVGMIEDISLSKRAEQDLAAEKERLAVTLNSIGDGVISTDVEGRILMLNPIAETLTGWKQSEAYGHFIQEVFPIVDESSRTPLESPVDRVIRTGAIVQLENVALLVTKDGLERRLADSGAPIRDHNHTIIGVVLVFRDVTEKQKMEEERLRASKLQSLGILAGGIAHDFNNILTAILSNISYVRSVAGLTEDLTRRLNESEKACVRARSLTQQLLTFSKGGAPVKSVFPVTALVRESCDFALRGSNVLCEYDFRDDHARVEADAGQLGQVIQNVVLNAVQAMPHGGTLRVMTAKVNLVSSGQLPLLPGDYTLITISDEGIGIEHHHLPKIFDPYFTTKDRGTGLGLAVSYSIIKNHQGHIHVVSEVGRGTTFFIYLPMTTKAPEKSVESLALPAKAKGRILVLDDEAAIGEITCELLAHFGFEAEHVSDGTDVIRRYDEARTAGTPFDALIMDLTIPGGMGGKETMRRILETDPNVKAIVSSGYSNDPVIADYKKYGFVGYIVKPYETDDLVRLLHRIIQGPAPTA